MLKLIHRIGFVEAIRHRRPLDPRHRDHALSGDWEGFRDCHIEPDWVLVLPDDARPPAGAQPAPPHTAPPPSTGASPTPPIRSLAGG